MKTKIKDHASFLSHLRLEVIWSYSQHTNLERIVNLRVVSRKGVSRSKGMLCQKAPNFRADFNKRSPGARATKNEG